MWRYKLGEGCALVIQCGDITKWSVNGETDAIVNATNQSLLGGDGVDGTIFAAAGPELLDHCRALPEVAGKNKKKKRCHTGQAVLTPAFKLHVCWIVHTVGPVYESMEPASADEYLREAYRNILELARKKTVTHIAFPAISCGVYKFPLSRAAKVATLECKACCLGFHEIHFVLDASMVSAWKIAVEQVLNLVPAKAQVSSETISCISEMTPCGSNLAIGKEATSGKYACVSKLDLTLGVSETTPSVSKTTPSGSELEICYIYSEIRSSWRVPSRLLALQVETVLYEDEFRKQREAYFRKCGIPDSLLTRATVYPEGYEKKKLSELIKVKGFLLYEPLSMPGSDKDLLHNQALQLQELLKKDPSISLVDPKQKKGQVMKQAVNKSLEERLNKFIQEHSALKKTVEEHKKTIEEHKNTIEEHKKTIEEHKKTIEEHNARIRTLEHDVARLQGINAVLARKLLDRCREKARDVLTEAKSPRPLFWNDVVVSPTCVNILAGAGLSKGALDMTLFGEKTVQDTNVAHNITEPPADYLVMINHTFAGGDRDNMLDVYRFVFEQEPVQPATS